MNFFRKRKQAATGVNIANLMSETISKIQIDTLKSAITQLKNDLVVEQKENASLRGAVSKMNAQIYQLGDELGYAAKKLIECGCKNDKLVSENKELKKIIEELENRCRLFANAAESAIVNESMKGGDDGK